MLRALRTALPDEQFIYLGDTARLPYGTKTRESIERYALQAASLLIKLEVKCLVVACNTASALALEKLRTTLAPLPVIGVVEPGAEAGCRASHSGRIAVTATEGTVRGGAYENAITRRRSDARVVTQACSLFVALAEEGLTDGPIVEAIAHRYLDPLFAVPEADRPDTLVLGCTHFPVLANALRNVVGEQIAIVDSAVTAALALEQELLRSGLRCTGLHRTEFASGRSLRLLATDGSDRFARVGSLFLGEPLNPNDVELVDLGI